MDHRGFSRTAELFERATRVIPGGIYGHQTPELLVPGAYPYFFSHGRGSHVFDVDGNEYVDWMCSYGPIVLGHLHPKVEEAVEAQRRKGDCFNGPTELWVELAERLVGMTPFADWAVFAKNGSDVCTWATAVARQATGRPKIVKAAGAYHGTDAWTTPLPAGTTPEDAANVLTFDWNDLAGLERVVAENEARVAGIILTPFRHDAFHDQEMPAEGFLQGVRALCDRKGIVFILDDVRAGFRLHLGGSGERFGVRPDLTCYCKAIANGYPLSACLGRRPLLDAAKHVFFTGSYFTAATPMAAALACLETLEKEGAIEKMEKTGSLLRRGLEEQARSHGLAIHYTGPEAIPFLTFEADRSVRKNRSQGTFERSRLFAAECCRRGVYLHPHHNWFVSAAHDDEDLRRTLDATDEAFGVVRRQLGN